MRIENCKATLDLNEQNARKGASAHHLIHLPLLIHEFKSLSLSIAKDDFALFEEKLQPRGLG